MICPVCSRLMKMLIEKWHEVEEMRTYVKDYYFCPCCGVQLKMIVEEIE